MTKLIAILMLGGAALCLLQGCNTVKGVGEDIQAIGEGTSELAEDAQDSLDD